MSYIKDDITVLDENRCKIHIKALADTLDNNSVVEFIYNNLYYEIFESSDSGYIVNVYTNNDKDQYGEYIESNLIDGGLCTGGVIDAIEFML